MSELLPSKASYRPGETIEIEVRGAILREQVDNCLRVEITDDDFEIRVAGFDVNRDVHIQARVKESEPADAAAT